MKSSTIIAVTWLVTGACSATAQSGASRLKWYWGAQGGAYVSRTPTFGTPRLARSVGGHWSITYRRSALYFALDRITFPSGTTSTIADRSAFASGGVRTVTFTNAHRMQAAIVVVSGHAKLQVFGGGGLAIHQITNATAQGPFASASEAIVAADAVSQSDTRAFPLLATGAQYRLGRWAVFALYNFMPGRKDFILSATQQAITGGIRYALIGGHEPGGKREAGQDRRARQLGRCACR